MPGARDRTHLLRAASAFWACYAAALLWNSCRVRLDYYDAFGYLATARRLAGDPVGFDAVHPPMLALLHAPLQWTLGRLGAGDWTRLWVPHLLQACLSLSCLAAFYRWLRGRFSPGWAHAGAALLASDRLFIHYPGSVLPDIPAALFFLLFLLLRDARRPGLSSAALGGALLCRYNIPLLLAALLIMEAFAARSAARETAAAFARALPLFALVCAAVPSAALGVPVAQTPRFLAGVLTLQFIGNQRPESWWGYADSLRACAGLPAIAFFLWASWTAARDKDSAAMLPAGAFLLFACAMSAVVGHKESRYLLPALPLFYAALLQGIERACSKGSGLRPAARAGLAALLLASAGGRAGREWGHFGDPAYRDPILLDLSAAIRAGAGPGARVFWTGSVYTLLPENPFFTAGDPGYFSYGIPSPWSLEYLLGKGVPVMDEKLIRTVRDGDIMVRAPIRPRRAGEPRDADRDRIEVVLRADGAWERVALLPRA